MMAVERFYVYRNGATDACALTRTKDDPRLPAAAAPDSWRFWMQIGRLQTENDRYGFNIQAAVDEIAAKGYSLFTGTHKLFGRDASASSTPSPPGGKSDV
jgi:hypothetical protein